jgi:hypothetical protein
MLQTSLIVALPMIITHSFFLAPSAMWLCAQFLDLPNRILLFGMGPLHS